MIWTKTENVNNLRVIKTARDKDSINESARKGFWPLIKVVRPSKDIFSKVCVLQNSITGEIDTKGDYRSFSTTKWFNNTKPRDDSNRIKSLNDWMNLHDDSEEEESPWKEVTSWIHYYPNPFVNPYAAYLIPSDIQIGERVFLEDLIEDYIGAKWNQGDTYRLPSCEAIWNGKDFNIQYDPEKNRRDFMG